jgi:hypothetical protein
MKVDLWLANNFSRGADEMRQQDSSDLCRDAQSGARQAWKDHQINVSAGWMAPFPKFLRQGVVLVKQRLGFEIL